MDSAVVLRTTLEAMDEGVIMVNADGRVTHRSECAMNLLHLPPKWLAQQPIFDPILQYQREFREFRLAQSSAADRFLSLTSETTRS